jgi:hypothetical protein
MRNFFLILGIVFFIAGCKDDKDANAKSSTGAASGTKYDYAYSPIDHDPVYWEQGDQQNLVNATKALKAYETGKLDEAASYFADSMQFTADYVDTKISRDTLKSWFEGMWQNTKSVKVEMDDYESVISKDKKKEYVTLWFKEIVTDKSGKVDSLVYVDDIGFKNGKIISMDEKTRHFPAKQ